MFVPDPDLDFLPIPDPGFRVQKGTGSRIPGESRSATLIEQKVDAPYLTAGSRRARCGFQLKIKNEKAETCIRKMSLKIQHIGTVLTYY
jgi:hypothetical protein